MKTNLPTQAKIALLLIILAFLGMIGLGIHIFFKIGEFPQGTFLIFIGATGLALMIVTVIKYLKIK